MVSERVPTALEPQKKESGEHGKNKKLLSPFCTKRSESTMRLFISQGRLQVFFQIQWKKNKCVTTGRSH